MNYIQFVLIYTSTASTLLPLTAGVSKSKNTLWYYVLTSFSCDVATFVCRRVFDINYYWVSNIFTIAEFVTITLFYHFTIIKNKLMTSLILMAMSWLFYATLPGKSFFNIDETSVGVYCMVFMGFSIAGLYKILKEQKELFLETSSFFWANVAILIYSSSNLLLFLYSEYIRKNQKSIFIILWFAIYLPMNIIKNILLAISFNKNGPRRPDRLINRSTHAFE